MSNPVEIQISDETLMNMVEGFKDAHKYTVTAILKTGLVVKELSEMVSWDTIMEYFIPDYI